MTDKNRAEMQTLRKGLWRHKKRGTDYRVLGCATMQAADNPLDDTPCVIYSDGKRTWIRPLDAFLDGRFEHITPSEEALKKEALRLTARQSKKRQALDAELKKEAHWLLDNFPG